MSVVLGNNTLFGSHSVCHQIESYLHESHKASIGIQKCVQRNLGSSKLSKNTVSAIKKLYPKKLSLFQKTRIAFYVVVYTLYKAFPIATDVVTDSLLVKQYHDEWINGLIQKARRFLFLEFPLHTLIFDSNDMKINICQKSVISFWNLISISFKDFPTMKYVPP